MIGPLSHWSPRSGRGPARWIALGLGLAVSAGAAISLIGVQSMNEAWAQNPKDTKPPARPAAPAAEAPPASPIRTETVVYDQWTVTCQDRVDGSVKRSCNAVLKVVDPTRNQVVLAWMLTRGADGKVETVIQTPTGVQVQRGLSLKLGDKAPRLLAFASCEPQNCEAASPVDAGMLREMQISPQAIATIYAKDGRGIQFTMPLGGIEKALSAVQS